MSDTSLVSRLRTSANRALDLLLPPLCLSCDAPVGAHRTLCAECWNRIHFIAPPFCALCGAPFEVPMGEGALCGACIAEPPEYAAARAPMLYDKASRRIVIGFKHADRTHPAPALAAWMHRAGMDFWAGCDYLAPIPLHRWRLFKRRYNQAALLAHELKRLANKSLLPDLLLRRRATPVQGHLGRKQRAENVKGAFALNRHYENLIRDKSIVLIDDVLTTGATVNECGRVLLKSGAKEIKVLTLARVRSL